MSAHSMLLTLALLLAAASESFAQTALSDWTPGVATNYGGTASGQNANVASYGLSNVSACDCMLQSVAAICTLDAIFLQRQSNCALPLEAILHVCQLFTSSAPTQKCISVQILGCIAGLCHAHHVYASILLRRQ